MEDTTKNYLSLRLRNPERVLSFLIEIMEFTVMEDHVAGKSTGVLIKDRKGNEFELIKADKAHANYKGSDLPIVITTPDCLKDYYRLKSKDLYFIGKPVYVTEGLAFDMIDHFGNRYTILEKRNYGDEQ